MIVFDLECNGLNPDLIYCVAWWNTITSEKGVITSYDKMREFFLKDTCLIGHRIILFDIPVVEKILNIKVKSRLVDTLALSWTLHPSLKNHGLADWGEHFGVPKPKVDDWENLPLETYIHRCKEDVKINVKLWDKLDNQLDALYEGNSNKDKYINYLSYKLDCIREQQENPVKFNLEEAQRTLESMEEEFERRKVTLAEVMPDNPIYSVKKYPAKPTKKDGSISSHGFKWLEFLAEQGLPINHTEEVKYIKSYEPGNPGSTNQLKRWLYDLGWIPITFKYERNKETSKVRKIEQISLPKLSGGGLCPSVIELIEDNPTLRELEGFFMIRHRKSFVAGMINNQKGGYITADMAGLTSTLRLKHSILVNMPGYTGDHLKSMDKDLGPDWSDGIHIRGLLCCEEDELVCGTDMSSLENNIKSHYMYFYDPDYVISTQVDGYDPHLDLALFAEEVTQNDLDYYFIEDSKPDTIPIEDVKRYKSIKKTRKSYKTCNYGAQYLIGAEALSRSIKKTVEEAKELLDAYWDKNWAIKKVADEVLLKEIDGQKWILNPISGFWIELRYMKDRFSALCQNSGVYTFDMYVRELRKMGYKTRGQWHDEVLIICKIDEVEQLKEDCKIAIQRVNSIVKLNVELGVSLDIGRTYAEAH